MQVAWTSWVPLLSWEEIHFWCHSRPWDGIKRVRVQDLRP